MTMRRKIFVFLLSAFCLVLAGILLFRYAVLIDTPVISTPTNAEFPRVKEGPGYRVDRAYLRKSRTGLWEIYAEGNAIERGTAIGKLTKELRLEQEKAFVGQMGRMVPSVAQQLLLKYGIAWYCRKLPDYIPREFQEEIYTVATAGIEEDPYDYVGPLYQRKLFYHAAHDIGHAVQNMDLVGCSSLGVWDQKSADGELIIGRNFDFFVGEEFARNKLLFFIKPDSGYAFASIAWPGFSGVVSGMNEKGLTITLNSAKSDIPPQARTPVSIVARQILQYAANIQEAYAIAQEYPTFVSETFLIGSAEDERCAIIEKTVQKTEIFEPRGPEIICTNHFQGEKLWPTRLNQENVTQSASMYRFQRIEELLEDRKVLDPASMADLLRDQEGMGGENIGMGNEKAVNQLICHHSVIFQPQKLRMWVSTPPWQLGEYVAYDLSAIFADSSIFAPLAAERYRETLPADPFLESQSYTDFLKFRERSEAIRLAVAEEERDFRLTREELNEFISWNPHYYETHMRVGEYHLLHQQPEKAAPHFQMALALEINKTAMREYIEAQLASCGTSPQPISLNP